MLMRMRLSWKRRRLRRRLPALVWLSREEAVQCMKPFFVNDQWLLSVRIPGNKLILISRQDSEFITRDYLGLVERHKELYP